MAGSAPSQNARKSAGSTSTISSKSRRAASIPPTTYAYSAAGIIPGCTRLLLSPRHALGSQSSHLFVGIVQSVAPYGLPHRSHAGAAHDVAAYSWIGMLEAD